jgi:hypothetical protein
MFRWLMFIASYYRGGGSHYPLYLFLCILESYDQGLIGPHDIIRIVIHRSNVFFKWLSIWTPGHVMTNTK